MTATVRTTRGHLDPAGIAALGVVLFTVPARRAPTVAAAGPSRVPVAPATFDAVAWRGDPG